MGRKSSYRLAMSLALPCICDLLRESVSKPLLLTPTKALIPAGRLESHYLDIYRRAHNLVLSSERSSLDAFMILPNPLSFCQMFPSIHPAKSPQGLITRLPYRASQERCLEFILL